MRGLIGDFGTMPLRDLVAYLGNRKASGTLQYDHGEDKKQVVLRDGHVVNASSNQPREFIAQFLINMGQLTEDQYLSAYQTQQQTRIFLGKILVMIGLVTEEAVRNALRLKFREALLATFDRDDGKFTFTPGAGPAPLQGLDVSVDLLEIHREADFRETAWKAIRAVFPSGRVRLQLHRENLPEEPEPGTLDDRLAQLIDDGASVDEMVLGLHSTDFFLYQRLYALHRLGAVTALPADGPVVPVVVPAVLGTEQGADEILRHAEAFLADGNVSDAAELARRAYELSPTPSTASVLRQLEATLVDQLRAELLAVPMVPSLRVPQASLRTLQLSAPERYLLSRIDGKRSVQAIVQVSPLQELDALRCFRSFLDSDLVALRRS